MGVVVNDHEKYEGRVLEDAFIASSLNALLYELEKNGYFMMVKATTEWNEIIRFASMRNMDGLVLIGFCDSDYEKLRDNMHIPFVVSDVYAIELMQFAQANGIQVPKQLSIVGFDNIGLCEKVHPTLTTVGQNPARRAGEAVQALVRLKEGEAVETVIHLPVELIVRESTAALNLS